MHGRYHYKVNKLLVESSRIPKAFEGFRIVQISDWHIGSFYGKPHRVQEAVDRINALKPDLILFTGDLVNNVAGEAENSLNSYRNFMHLMGFTPFWETTIMAIMCVGQVPKQPRRTSKS